MRPVDTLTVIEMYRTQQAVMGTAACLAHLECQGKNDVNTLLHSREWWLCSDYESIVLTPPRPASSDCAIAGGWATLSYNTDRASDFHRLPHRSSSTMALSSIIRAKLLNSLS
nr:hypothetical protein J6590_027226 [Homalodisca vitripennis]